MSSWFSFGRKKNKNGKDKTNKGNVFTSAAISDGNVSGSITNPLLFPMQYTGCTYTLDAFPDELLFIPYKDPTIPRHNPSNLFSSRKRLNHKYGATALLIHGNPKNNPTHFMILFHGNGVDLGLASVMWRPLTRSLPIHLLIVEYPGYGIMDGRCSCKEVIKVAEHIYDYVTRSKHTGGLGISPHKLMILGRSIGTGPAAHIAKLKCQSLILVSPFTSIHNLSSELMGKWTKWFLPQDFGTVMDNEEENIYDKLQLQTILQTASDPYQTSMLEEQKGQNMDGDDMDMQYAQTLPNDTHPFTWMSDKNTDIKDSTTVIKRKKEHPAFVFNNIAQIEKWQCKNLMVFHGKKDTVIPYSHSNTIVNRVRNKKPELEATKFLIEGGGHNDLSIQFIGLRIFMQYQEELQPYVSVNSKIDIDALVSYLDCPPQFDVVSNKVQNYSTCVAKKGKIRTHIGTSSVPSLFDSGEEEQEQNIKMINEWDAIQCKFKKYQRELPSKIYDLTLKLKADAQIKQRMRGPHINSTKRIRIENK
eukprot:101042_1